MTTTTTNTTIRGALRRMRHQQSARFLRVLLIAEARTKAAALDQALVDELQAAGLERVAEAIVGLRAAIDAAALGVSREDS